MDPEAEPDFLGVAGDDDGVLGLDPGPKLPEAGLEGIVVCVGLTNGVEEFDMLFDALSAAMEEVVTIDGAEPGFEPGMEILIVVLPLD